jgi:hypothetical protein
MHRSMFFLILTLFLAMGTISCGDDTKNPAHPDTTPPVVTLLVPENGLVMPGPRSFPFQARATDDTGVVRVEFLFDNVVVGQDSTASPDSSGVADLYDYTWQNSPLAAGNHHVTARAHDKADNSSDAPVATITITAR